MKINGNILFAIWFCFFRGSAFAQDSVYQTSIEIEPPYYQVRYEASANPDELIYPVSFTVWVPPGVHTLRGLIVHQHGCGEGSCKSGQTGAFDLHWQALALRHDCALMSPSYEQPDKADCQLWCDPRNGSDVVFRKSLSELGSRSRHPELADVPWAIWGHSGGGHWAGGMVLLHPERVAAAWLRSGVPALAAVEGKPKPYDIPEGATAVPLMCNLGTKEGVTFKEGQFAGVWKNVEIFVLALRAKGGLVAVAIDPLTSHECGNQRYLAIPWFDTCLSLRLPNTTGLPLKSMQNTAAWLAPIEIESAKSVAPVPQAEFQGAVERSVWLPSESVATAWTQYITDTAVTDATPPPPPTNIRVQGAEVTWNAVADLESGLASFIIERDGEFLANVPEQGKNPFGRPVFQKLQYSDTPAQPLVRMQFTDSKPEIGKIHQYRVIAVNTVGLMSK